MGSFQVCIFESYIIKKCFFEMSIIKLGIL